MAHHWDNLPTVHSGPDSFWQLPTPNCIFSNDCKLQGWGFKAYMGVSMKLQRCHFIKKSQLLSIYSTVPQPTFSSLSSLALAWAACLSLSSRSCSWRQKTVQRLFQQNVLRFKTHKRWTLGWGGYVTKLYIKSPSIT